MTSAETQGLASDLSLAVVRLTRQLRGRRPDAEISLTQLSALATLAHEGPMSPGALAARERVQPPSMTRVVTSLAALGLVDRKSHPTDGRQLIVTPTAAGQALIADETSAREAWMTEQLTRLPDEQLRVLREAVRIIDTIVNQAE